MTPMEIEFCYKILCVFVASMFIFKCMMVVQSRKQKEADEKYEFTMKLIEMRNKKHEVSNESEKKN